MDGNGNGAWIWTFSYFSPFLTWKKKRWLIINVYPLFLQTLNSAVPLPLRQQCAPPFRGIPPWFGIIQLKPSHAKCDCWCLGSRVTNAIFKSTSNWFLLFGEILINEHESWKSSHFEMASVACNHALSFFPAWNFLKRTQAFLLNCCSGGSLCEPAGQRAKKRTSPRDQNEQVPNDLN